MSSKASNQHPNFIYIGTSKAGSTWLFDVLARHPEVYMMPAKGLYFFDHHFDRGWPWYREHFAAATSEKIVAEISHSYLYSEQARERILDMNPDIKLMVCLRNPIERAVSMYLDGVRNGKWSGTFEQRIEDTREVVEEGCYAKYLAPYLEFFPREQIHITLFDELQEDPAAYAHRIFDFLDVAQVQLEQKMHTKVMPASLPRNDRLCGVAKSMSKACRSLGWRRLRGRVKRSRLIRNFLYRQLGDSERLQIRSSAQELLRERFQSDVEQLDNLLGTQLVERWGFATEHQPASVGVSQIL